MDRNPDSLKGDEADTSLVIRTVHLGDKRTSVRLEPELWDALDEVCQREAISMGELIRRAVEKAQCGSRTSVLRVYALAYFRAAATEAGHRTAGHCSLMKETWSLSSRSHL